MPKNKINTVVVIKTDVVCNWKKYAGISTCIINMHALYKIDDPHFTNLYGLCGH